MYIGSSIFLIALGAILRYAVTVSVSGFNIQTAGTILIVAGIIGLLVSLFLLLSGRDRHRDVVVDERPVVEERPVVRERRY